MDKNVMNVMKYIMGFTTFKSSHQREGVLAVLQGDHDVFINLPPNSGKSLCYQLPAIISQEKSAIVFVRNNNVAQEHVEFFIGKNVNVCHMDSSLEANRRREQIEQLICGKPVTSLIYIPISLCNKSSVKDLISTLGSRNSISIFVIDEAIYLSKNSASFNKLSLNIMPLRNIFPNVPLVILTSCGSHQIKRDIFDALSIKNPREIISKNWILSNIYIQVKFKDIISNIYEDLIELINNFKDTIPGKLCGIIFCRANNETATVARELSRLLVPTVPYNASMKLWERKKNESMWKNGKATIIVTTHDSGIGLDYPNVTCIIHWSVPLSISQYYQEIGKAGRNGVRALCCVYFGLNDWMYIKELTMGMPPQIYSSSEKMIQFCLSEKCRHTIYSRYFGAVADECAVSCDFCTKKDDIKNSLRAFNEFQTQHRLLPFNPPKRIANALNAGIYDVQNAKAIIKTVKPTIRFYWYTKLKNVLGKNYEVANRSIEKKMTINDLCRLARNLEYTKLFTSHGKATYMSTLSRMVDGIIKQTKTRSLSHYISNYHNLIDKMEQT